MKRPRSNPLSRSTLPRATRQPTPEELLARCLAILEARFYAGHPVNFVKDRPRLLDWVVLWPARWLNNRGVTLPPKRYAEIFERVFSDAQVHSTQVTGGGWGRILLPAVAGQVEAGLTPDRVNDRAAAGLDLMGGCAAGFSRGLQSNDRRAEPAGTKAGSGQKAAEATSGRTLHTNPSRNKPPARPSKFFDADERCTSKHPGGWIDYICKGRSNELTLTDKKHFASILALWAWGVWAVKWAVNK